MVDIIRLHDDPHERTQSLLPWYANGTLNADDLVTVEAHLAKCAQCRAELRTEQAMARQIASLPSDVDRGWAGLRERLEASAPKPQPTRWRAAAALLARPAPIGWAIAAQAASILAIAALFLASGPHARQLYQTLGSAAAAPAARTANVVVIFRPTASEQALRSALVASDARLVDGPTASDAYVLHVAPAHRASALAQLRANANVELAEPIDGDIPR